MWSGWSGPWGSYLSGSLKQCAIRRYLVLSLYTEHGNRRVCLDPGIRLWGEQEAEFLMVVEKGEGE